MRRPVVRGVVGLTLLGLALPVALLVSRPASADDDGGGSAVTKRGEGRFSHLAMTVSQTTHMRNQVVKVSWAGAQPTAMNGSKFRSGYLQIMQCWGEGDAPKRDNCQFGGIVNDTRGGFQSATRQVNYGSQIVDPDETILPTPGNPAMVPFTAVNGKTVTGTKNEFFDSYSTNEIDYGRTASDGTGEDYFEVQTAREAPGLGCGARLEGGGVRNCWLVVVPRDDIEVNGQNVSDTADNMLVSSPLGVSNFRHAISFPLDFEPIGVACPIGSPERRLLGNEVASEAITRWQPALCDSTGSIFGFSQLGDDIARGQTMSDDPWLAVVGGPVPPEANTDGRLITYAPLTVSGVGIAVNIERSPTADATAAVRDREGSRVLDLKLNARLVAKLLTQSYPAAVPAIAPYLTGNPRTMGDDPEFRKLNPEFKQLQYPGRLFAITNPLGLSDANAAIWRWVASDAQAVAFLSGKKDPWGMHVNKYYKDLDLAREDFPRADPSCTKYPYSDSHQTPLCSLDWLAYAGDFHAAARGEVRGQTLSTAQWDNSATPPRYKAVDPQPSGSRSILALVDTATAQRYQLPMASLQNARGDFVAPDVTSMTAALEDLVPVDGSSLTEPDLTRKTKGAYPLTQVSYAATAPALLSKDEAKDYAAFVKYAATDGQTPGVAAGDLPAGYVPLSASMRKQAVSAADEIAERKAAPATKPTSEQTTDPSGGGTTTDTGEGGGGDTGYVAGDGTTPGASTPSSASSQGPVVNAGPVVTEPVSSATPAVPAGRTRLVLALALAIGLLAAAGRLVVPALARPGAGKVGQ